jgi:hypothetical protein
MYGIMNAHALTIVSLIAAVMVTPVYALGTR